MTRRETVYSGQVNRFFNVGPVPRRDQRSGAARFTLRSLVRGPAPARYGNTQTVYSCRRGAADYLLALDCAGDTRLGVVGQFYVTPPTGVPTIPFYRCLVAEPGALRVADPACEGQVIEATARLHPRLWRGHPVRGHQRAARPAVEHHPGAGAVPGGQPSRHAVDQPGGRLTVPLMSCQTGEDVFSSTDPGARAERCSGESATCGRTAEGVTASARAVPLPQRHRGPVRFPRPGCEGGALDRSLGYVVTEALTPLEKGSLPCVG